MPEYKHVVVVTTEIDDLWRQGFGTIETARKISAVLGDCRCESRLAIIQSKSDLVALVDDGPDLVLSGINYLPGGDGPDADTPGSRLWISDVMEAAGINCAGSPRRALELTIDKAAAKAALQRGGVPTAPFFVATPGMFSGATDLPVPLPLFVKPLFEGDGRGIGPDSVARTFDQYVRKVESIEAEWGQAAIAEMYLEGPEFTVARLGGDDADPVLLPLDLRAEAGTHGERILGFDAKQANREGVQTVTDASLRDRLLGVACDAFRVLLNRDYGRVDLRMDSDGRLYVLEANFIPGLTDRYSYFPLACELYLGLGYAQTIREIARVAMLRSV